MTKVERSEQLELPLNWHMFGEHLNKPTPIKVESITPSEGYNYIFEPVPGNRQFKTAYLLTTYLPAKGFDQVMDAMKRHTLLVRGLVEKVERNSLSTTPLRLVEFEHSVCEEGHQETKMIFGTKTEFDGYRADCNRSVDDEILELMEDGY